MKKILGIVLIFFLVFNGKVYSDMATCFVGECDFFIGIWYEYAETNCMDNLYMEEVDQGPLGFTIEATGEYCMVFNER
tara:strand:+ start:20 stop:253 length:234 start_codon:yes stop_codon:yes gene_type:complete